MEGKDRKQRVLIMTSGILPVPAVRGGAVEKLLTDIIDENEIKRALDITLVTIADEDIPKDRYHSTRLIQVKRTAACRFADRVVDKLQRMAHVKRAVRLFDKSLMKAVNAKTDISEFDVVIVENMASSARDIVTAVQKSRSKAKVFFHVHNNIDMYRAPADLKRLAEEGVTFISVSEYIKDEICRSAPGAKVSVLLNGLDTKLMDISLRAKKDKLREKYCIPGTAKVVLYSGRIIAEKGVGELANAFVLHKKAKSASDLFLVLAGDTAGADGKITRYAEGVFDQLRNVPDDYKMLGKVPYAQIAEVYAMADVLAVPTLDNEPFGMVVLEGMAMGLPIITTGSGGIAEVLEDAAGSMKVSKDNILGDLTAALDKISDHGFDDRLDEMGKHNLSVFHGKSGVNKEEYYNRFCMQLK